MTVIAFVLKMPAVPVDLKFCLLSVGTKVEKKKFLLILFISATKQTSVQRPRQHSISLALI